MTYPLAFVAAIERILGHEGGYVNDPEDPGGETKWGISKRSYPAVNIRMLSREQAIEIYFKDFWEPLGLHRLYDGTAFQLLDSAVNSGIAASIRFLQRAIDVADDGIAGPVTFDALIRLSEAQQILLFIAERQEYMTKLKNWPKHGKGWIRRMCMNMRYAAKDIEEL